MPTNNSCNYDPTQHAVQVGGTSGALTSLSVGANNSILMGSTGADPAFTTSGTPYVSGLSFDSGSNTMANYVVGTWTPTLVGGSTAGTTTYVAQNGFYIRIGALVSIWGTINVSAATGTGQALISSLPFTIHNATGFNPIGSVLMAGASWSWPSSTTTVCLQGLTNTTTAGLYAYASATTGGYISITNSSMQIGFHLTYQI